MKKTDVCLNCKFFLDGGKEAGSECRRNPPEHMEGLSSSFPYVCCTDWCGEFVLKVEGDDGS